MTESVDVDANLVANDAEPPPSAEAKGNPAIEDLRRRAVWIEPRANIRTIESLPKGGLHAICDEEFDPLLMTAGDCREGYEFVDGGGTQTLLPGSPNSLLIAH